MDSVWPKYISRQDRFDRNQAALFPAHFFDLEIVIQNRPGFTLPLAEQRKILATQVSSFMPALFPRNENQLEKKLDPSI